MKDLKLYGQVIISLSLLLWAIFQFSKDTFTWPDFVAQNIFYICLGLTAIGYILICTFYIKTKNPKKMMELVLTAVVIIAFFLLVKLFSR